VPVKAKLVILVQNGEGMLIVVTLSIVNMFNNKIKKEV